VLREEKVTAGRVLAGEDFVDDVAILKRGKRNVRVLVLQK
jgi:hypothetical protein